MRLDFCQRDMNEERFIFDFRLKLGLDVLHCRVVDGWLPIAPSAPNGDNNNPAYEEGHIA